MRFIFSIFASIFFSSLSLSGQWVSVPSITGTYLNQVFFATVDTGFIMSEQQLFKTTDGGHNWMLQYTFSSPGSSRMYFYSTQCGWASRSDGLYRTTDGGITWNNINSAIMNASTHFINEAEGWFVVENSLDYESYIYHTIDSGFTCVIQYTLNDLLYDLYFPSDSVGYVAGNLSNILKTSNKGNTWSHPSPGRLINIENVQFINENIGFISGEWLSSYFSLKTINGGNTWSTMSLDSNEWHSIYFIAADTGWAINYSGQIMKTTDSGNTWATELNNPSLDFMDVFISNSTHGCVIGNFGEIFIMDSNTTKINQVKFSVGIKIYPNPSHDQITIDCGSKYSSLNGYSLRIENIMGQAVYSRLITLQNYFIDLNALSGNGLYLIYLLNDSDQIMDVKKVVIQ